MTPELTVLALAGLLQSLQYTLYAVPANVELSPKYTCGPRDIAHVPLSPHAARLQRALNNHFEGLILFSLAVLVITASNQSTALTHACAYIYLGARVLYIPAYAFGLTPWRSLIWAAGFAATNVMLLAAFF
jgi:uncharacterized MAPEG superfamily protein